MGLENSIQAFLSVFLVICHVSCVNRGEEIHINIPVQNYLVNCVQKQYVHVSDYILANSILKSVPVHVKQSGSSTAHINVRSIDKKQYFLTLTLLLCGDVHPCPGPARLPRYPCTQCNKGVRKNSKAVSCDWCEQWTHIKCCDISDTIYNNLVQQNQDFPFTCIPCQAKTFPFQNCEKLDFDLNSQNKESPESNTETQNKNSVNDSSHYECFRRKGLHFIHINARSLLPKISEIKLIAANSKAAVIGISETWLDESVSDSEVEIENYTIYRKDRNRNGGGVCAYVRSDFAYNKRQDLQKEGLEAVWLELILPKTKPILICIGYRPPKQSNFFELLENSLLEYDNLSDREFYLLGDININLNQKKSRNSLFNTSLYDWCHIFDLTQIITESTRISNNSESLIDHIYTSVKEKIAQSGVLNFGFSDHCVIYCTRKTVRSLFNRHNTIKIRSLKNYSPQKLNEELNSVDWTEFYNCVNVDEALNLFCRIFISTLDKLAPLKSVRVKQRTEPWITQEILQSIHDRDKSFYTFRKSRKSRDYTVYCKLRNIVQRMVKKAKKEYIDEQIQENKHIPKRLWKSLRTLGYSNKNKQKTKIGLRIHNEICFEEDKVANEFNSFYTTVAASLVEKLPTSCNIFGSEHVNKYYSDKGIQQNSFSLNPVTPECILKHLQSLKRNKSTGLDGVSAKFLNDSAQTIFNQVTHIINLSINTSTVPSSLKCAKVVPLYKKDNKFEVGNYRPVSILCSLSKILERVIYNQLEEYLVSNNLLYNFQSGFRSNFSTDTCLIHLTDHIKQEISSGKYVGMVLIDLRKAFDTVNHEILCTKLKSLGLNQSSVNWFNSYLTDRSQLVECNGTQSKPLSISCGVPQGSILGPILFNLYVNDMESAVSCKLLLYADDSALIVSHSDTSFIEETLSTELENLSTWLVDNKLSLHLGKTESILFGSKRRIKKASSLNITCNGININSCSEVKYLGAMLDQTLSGESQAKNILKKSCSKLKYLYRQGQFLNKDSRKTLSQSLILSQFDYTCSSWFSGLTDTFKKRLQICQNKLARYVLNLSPRSHIGPEELSNIGWLDVQHRANQLKLNHIHAIYNNTCPEYLLNNFSKISDFHRYNTRSSSHNFHMPQANSIIKKTFYYTGIKLWNSLPNSIKSVPAKSAFKKEVKQFLNSEMFRREADVFFYY